MSLNFEEFTSLEIDFEREVINSRFSIFTPLVDIKEDNFAEDVREGLVSEKKHLNPKYFYNLKGSRLFENITELQEYYLTRTESTILKTISPDLSKIHPDLSTIIEIGSGNSEKTKHILNSFTKSKNMVNYIPVDISNILFESGIRVTKKYRNLYVQGILSDYMNGIELASVLNGEPKIFIFLGSSIGNFDYIDSVSFLQMIQSNMGVQDKLLVGFDLVKNKNILELAYNDKQGITAEFNKNILQRINRELDANFDLNKFKHYAFFNENKSRMEMHLVSQKEQRVKIEALNETIEFTRNESIHTENSYKYTPEMIQDLADRSNLEIENYFSDDNNYFALYLFGVH